MSSTGCWKMNTGEARKLFKLLQAKLKNYPKGALNVRGKKIKDKKYFYHYLVRRDGEKIVNLHVAEQDLPKIKKQIEEREKCRKEILSYKKRILYLAKLLKKSKREGGREK